MSAVPPQEIFVCYSSADFKLLKELEKFLVPLCQKHNLKLWFDRQIEAGERWRTKIDAALAQSQICLLLLSPDFYNCTFIMETELPVLLERNRGGQLRMLLVPLRDCLNGHTELAEYQAVWPINMAYASQSKKKKGELLHQLAKAIEACLVSPPTAKPAPFRVQLLATESDLGETRQKVASYLRQQGIEVCDASTAARDCDHLVLLQAWQWQAGALVQIWEHVPKEKRSLFLIAPTAAWPAHLIEMSACADLARFREQHGLAAHSFDRTEVLPAMVGELLDPIRRAHQPAGAPETGLSPVERAYLTLNLPAWRNGRNQLALGDKKTGGHDINRIYNKNLYVAMDGSSQRYGRNQKGELVRLPDRAGSPLPEAKPKAKKEEAFENRLPLAVWAGAPALRWLVISGSPGAGKTIFLTHVAAQLAARLLGEELHAQGLETLCPKSGLGPIPVVLEAVKLADQAPGLSGMAAALRQALAIAGQRDLPSTQRLESQLSEGRFLLLVDALDEVGSEQQRRALVDLLKGLAALCPGRLLLTTRSARYTGEMPYGPEFEIVELMPFNRAQVAQFCHQYRVDQQELPGFEQDLANAIAQLERERSADGESFSGNALMLTTLCWLYKRDRRLPDDRVGLCSRLVDGLCEARPHAGPDGRILTWDEKRKHLAQLALAMQKASAQSYGHSACLGVIAAHLPSAVASDRGLHERLLRCLVEQTGLMYYQADAMGREQLRFAHRLLREYLAALCLCGEDRIMDTLVADLARDGHLTDPLWHDIVCMLPGVANSQPKAETYAKALRTRARAADSSAARLWGILAATLVENQHLYPDYDVTDFCNEALARYEREGRDWPREVRYLLLEGIGRLGDPRLDWQRDDYWVSYKPGRFIMGDRDKQRKVEVRKPFALAKYPVTHGEYQRFFEAGGYTQPVFWSDAGKDWLKAAKENGQPENFAGFCHPNQPRVGVSYYEAEAYCAWLSEQQRVNHLAGAVRFYLPSEVQWEYAARGEEGRPFPWGSAEPGDDHANIEHLVGRTSPVGAYPQGQTPEGLWDMGGNVWEWTSSLYEPAGARRVLRGGGWVDDGRYARAAYRYAFGPGGRFQGLGFRLARGQVP